MRPRPEHRCCSVSSQRQRGVFVMATAVALLVLLGFVGLAIDVSRLQLVRSELQNAADACALAAVLELNALPDAGLRGEQAGLYAGGVRNRRDFQTVWVGRDRVVVSFGATAGGSFQAASTGSGGAGSGARFARCAVTDTGLRHFFVRLFGPASSDLSAIATATTMPSQSVCSIPMGMCAGSGSNASNFGYNVGDTVRLGASQSSGYFTWANVLGTDTSGGLEPYVEAFMSFGVCDVPTAPGRCIGIKTGVVTSLDDGWNARFGMYKQGGSGLDPATAIPDVTGYGYRPAPAGGAYADYMQNRAPSRQAFQGNISSYKSPLGVHTQYGASSRRLVSMPVVACTSSSCGSGSRPVIGWACALMLSPKSPSQDAEVEFRGRADNPASGCTASGVPGGMDSGGPLVPVLVN